MQMQVDSKISLCNSTNDLAVQLSSIYWSPEKIQTSEHVEVTESLTVSHATQGRELYLRRSPCLDPILHAQCACETNITGGMWEHITFQWKGQKRWTIVISQRTNRIFTWMDSIRSKNEIHGNTTHTKTCVYGQEGEGDKPDAVVGQCALTTINSNSRGGFACVQI